MNMTMGSTARFAVAAMLALGVSLTPARAQDYTDCAPQQVRVKATRDARPPCPAPQASDAYLQWAVDRHRAALGSVYLTAQNPVAPRDARARDGKVCSCGVLVPS